MAFEFPIRIYWEDTDAGGIVFYANYLKFFERARTEWLRSLGISQQALRQSTGGMFVVSETGLKYHRPARLDDELLVTASMAPRKYRNAGVTAPDTSLVMPGLTRHPWTPGQARGDDVYSSRGAAVDSPRNDARPRASLTIEQQAWRKTGGSPELLCEGTIRIGWVDAASLKPARIPPSVLEVLK